MSGLRSRRKGHDWERGMAQEMRAIFPEARRGLQYQDGAGCADVVGVGPFWMECKRGKRTNVKAALLQAEEACGDRPYWPVAVCRDDGEEATVTMRLADWMDLVKEWKERGER